MVCTLAFITTNLVRFRWVFCQLDALKKYKKRTAVLQTLKSLPRTVEETYGRIILAVDDVNRPEAHRALLWLAFSKRPLILEEIAEAAVIDPDSGSGFNPDDRLRDPQNDILEILGSLVTISSKTNDWNALFPMSPVACVNLTDFSVKEFVLSAQHPSRLPAPLAPLRRLFKSGVSVAIFRIFLFMLSLIL
jgi:hypothetical protein